MKNLRTASTIIKKRMVKNGTITKIDNRIAKHDQVAISLGYSDANMAYQSMGTKFLDILRHC